MRTEWRFSSNRMTVWVETDGLRITDAAPIVTRFIGQRLENLHYWMIPQGGFFRTKLEQSDDRRKDGSFSRNFGS